MLIPTIKLRNCCDNNFLYIISLSLPHIVCLYVKLAFVSILHFSSIMVYCFPLISSNAISEWRGKIENKHHGVLSVVHVPLLLLDSISCIWKMSSNAFPNSCWRIFLLYFVFMGIFFTLLCNLMWTNCTELKKTTTNRLKTVFIAQHKRKIKTGDLHITTLQ